MPTVAAIGARDVASQHHTGGAEIHEGESRDYSEILPGDGVGGRAAVQAGAEIAEAGGKEPGEIDAALAAVAGIVGEML